jgi:aerobic-type carbon monoxide dehydrogenase small subunit (CoxS/CutS family)
MDPPQFWVNVEDIGIDSSISLMQSEVLSDQLGWTGMKMSCEESNHNRCL